MSRFEVDRMKIAKVPWDLCPPYIMIYFKSSEFELYLKDHMWTIIFHLLIFKQMLIDRSYI